MRKLLKLYNNRKLQTKLTITHLVIATIPMIVIGIFFYTKLYDMIIADTIRTEQGASAKTAPLIEDTVNKVLDVHQKITSQNFYIQLSNTVSYDTFQSLPMSQEAISFEEELESLKDGDLIKEVKIYLDIPESEPIFTNVTTNNTFLPINCAKGTYWNGIFSGSPFTSELCCPSFYLGPNEIIDYGELAYITKSSIYYQGEQQTCYTAIYYSKEYLERILKDNSTSDTSVATLINERDSTIATSNESLVGTYHFDYDTVQKAFMSSNNFMLKHVMNEDVYAGFYNISNSGWYMVVAMPSKPMIAKSIWIMAAFILVYIACIFISLIIATALSHSITKRLSTVINQMATSRTEPPIALPPSDTQDEIGDLIDTYNHMTTVITRLIKEQTQAAEDLRIVEFSALQAQINPHFLYNTMDMINWLSQQGAAEDASFAIQSLSKFYKLTLSRKKEINTIADELEHVSIYVNLQNMRYHDNIEFIIDIPDSLLEYSIPKLTFQPVVENAIIHGILEKPSKSGTIVLTGWLEENAMIILITDDGVGISQEKIQEILTGNGASKSGTNIAVYNTHRRLKLLYGTSYGLAYTSTVGKGTEVEIRLPLTY